MQREVVVVPAFWTVNQVTQFIKDSMEAPDVFYEVFVVDAKYHPIGSVPLSHLLRNKKDAVIEHIMMDDIKAIPVGMDQEEVAQLFQQYVLLSAPVVDISGRIIGMITVDDVVDVIVQEAEEDLLHVAGIKEVHADASILKSAYQRIQWLFATLLNTIIASIVISHFQHTIEHQVALAILMPIAAAMGGNAGMQVVTLTVRAIAMRELVATAMWRTVFKEIAVCGINGMVFGLLLGCFAATWFSDPRLGYILGGAMMFNMLWAGLIRHPFTHYDRAHENGSRYWCRTYAHNGNRCDGLYNLFKSCDRRAFG
jgi:magnesium transporter